MTGFLSTDLFQVPIPAKVDLYSCEIEDPLAIEALRRVKTESCKLQVIVLFVSDGVIFS